MNFRPVPIHQKATDCELIKGTIIQIEEAGTNDIVLRLKETETRFYINRGLEKGLSLTTFREHLLGKQVEIYYPKYWTALLPQNDMKHLSKLVINGEVIISEL